MQAERAGAPAEASRHAKRLEQQARDAEAELEGAKEQASRQAKRL